MRVFLIALFSSMAFSVQAMAAVEFKLPKPELETLPNGLEIVWFVDQSLPVVDLMLLVKSGYRDDPQGKSGTAELVSKLLDRGAGGLSAAQLSEAVERLGASRYSSTDDDTFSVGMHGLAQDAEELLGLLAKIVLKPAFSADEFSREKARLLDRWNHLGDYGETLASIAYHRILASATDYARGSFHSVREFQAVKREDVQAYHQRHFTPKNSVLLVVGKVDRSKFRKELIDVFGSWQGEVPKRDWKPFVEKRIKARQGSVVLVGRKGLTQAQVRMGFRGPSLHSPEHYDLAVANALLGEYFHSRLNTIIRDKLGLTYGIGSSFSYSRDFSKFTVSAATANQSVGQLIQKAKEILAEIKSGKISQEEVITAKEYLIGGFPLSLATLQHVASRWVSGYVYGLGTDYLDAYVPKVSVVTQESVLKAVAKHLRLEELVVVVAGDPAEVGKSLGKSGLPFTRVSVKDLR